MSREERIAAMMKMAQELAAHGHRVDDRGYASGQRFPEAAEFFDQPHIRNELKQTAERARQHADTNRAIRED